MQTKQRTNTEAMVECVNRINATTNEIEVKLREAFAPLVGKTILKNDHTLMKKYEHLKPKGSGSTQIWQFKSSFDLCFQVRGSETGIHANYHSCYASIGSIVDGVLVRIYTEKSNRRTDWSVEEVVAARFAIRKAEDELLDAKRALGPFYIHER